MSKLKLLRVPQAQSLANADNHTRYHFREDLTGSPGQAVYTPFDPNETRQDTVLLAAVENGEVYITRFDIGATPPAADELTSPLQWDDPAGQAFEFDPALDADARDITVSIGTKKYNGDIYLDAEPQPYSNPYAPVWDDGGINPTLYVKIHIHKNDGSCIVIERELTSELRAPEAVAIEHEAAGGPITITASAELTNPDIVLLNQPRFGYVTTPLPAAGYGYPILVPQHTDVAGVVADVQVSSSSDSYEAIAQEAIQQSALAAVRWIVWPTGVPAGNAAEALFASPGVVRLDGAGIIDVSG